MFCWHKWNVWGDIQKWETVGGWVAFSQTRKCTKCGKIQMRKITNY